MTKTTPPGQTGTTWQPVYSQINNHFSLSGANVTYEADGDLTNDSYHSYTWDAQGHPTEVDTTAMTTDALGRLVECGGQALIWLPAGVNWR